MADADEQVLLKGKDLNDYRVVDLKKECDRRGLSKAGNKQEIVERLKAFLKDEQHAENKEGSEEGVGALPLNVDAEKNDVIKSYLEKQKKLLEDRQQEIKRFSEESASEDNESPTKKDKPELLEQEEKTFADVGAGDTRTTRRRSNSSNHNNTDDSTIAEVTSPTQPKPKRGWRKSKEDTVHPETHPTHTDEETVLSRAHKTENSKDESVHSETGCGDTAISEPVPHKPPTEEVNKQRQAEPVADKKEEETEKSRDEKETDKESEAMKENTTVSRSPKIRASSTSSERSNDHSPDRYKGSRRRSSSASSSDRSRSNKKGKSRSSSSSSSSSSRERPARKGKSRSKSSSSSRSRSRSSSPEKEAPSQSRSKIISRKSRSRSSSSSSRSPSPVSKQKTTEMEVGEAVSTTQDDDGKPSTYMDSSGMEVDDSDTKPDTTAESINEKDVDGDQRQSSDVSTQKSVARISSTGHEKEEEEKSEDKENVKEKPVRKRKWGSKTGQPTGAKKISSYNISTDSLKGIIPDVKMSEPVLDLGNDDEKISDAEEDKRDVKIRRTVVVKDDQPKEELEEGEAPESPEEGEAEEEEGQEENKMEVEDERKVKADPVIVRRVSQKKPLIETEEPSKVKSRSPSPARNPVSNIVHVRNLVRPFTVLQLKDLLKRKGKLLEDKFWIDSIKSHCYATYETEEEAVETRKALHGTQWPSSNPKILQVDYATPEEIEYHKQEEEAPRLAREKALKEAKAKKEEDKKRKAEREARLAKKKEEEAKKKAPPVREWDRDKIRQSEEKEEQTRKRRPSSESPTKDKHRRERSKEKEREKDKPARKEKTEKKDEEEPPAKLLDDLFKKTKATPCIYWLPLTEAQAAEKAKEREAERERRLKEREKRNTEPSPPRRNPPPEKDRRPQPPRGRMDDFPRRRSPDRRPLPDMRDRRR